MAERSGGATATTTTAPPSSDSTVDPQLWLAFAGSSSYTLPHIGSTVIYFPQGHSEQADLPPPRHSRFPPAIACKLLRLDFLADKDTDETYARLRLLPLHNDDLSSDNQNPNPNPSLVLPEKPASFAKTLTQSDANNGGGFSIPRFCAETIFPRLDYSQDPPVQTVLAKDVHGSVWKFRHIYRGTPRRHLLTTGWSNFVNHKKLVAGDVVVFTRSSAGELCIGVRRSNRTVSASGPHRSMSVSRSFGAKPPLGLSESPIELTSNSSRALVSAQSVLDAMTAAASGKAFEAVYYPRASSSGFCVKADAVKSALQHNWAPGMRFKMAIETEDASRTSWYMGTVLNVHDQDPVHWPNSAWKMLQVTWDEHVLHNIGRVSPWQVELVSPMLLPPLSLPKKKARLCQPQEFQLDGHGQTIPAPFHNNVLGNANFWHGIATTVHPGMEGTRHSNNYGLPPVQVPINYNTGLLLDSLYQQQHSAQQHLLDSPMLSSIDHFAHGVSNSSELLNATHNNSNHLTALTVGSSSNSDPASSSNVSCGDEGRSSSSKRTHFLLFGKAIDITQSEKAQPPQLLSGESSSDVQGHETLSDGNHSEVYHSNHQCYQDRLETPSLSLQQGDSSHLDSCSNEMGTRNWFKEHSSYLENAKSS